MFRLEGERRIAGKSPTGATLTEKAETRKVRFVCEAEVQGILVRMENESVHLRGVAGGRCLACRSKDTYPWMDSVTQATSWEVHPNRCNYAYSLG